MARFERTFCSSCGEEFGPGDNGYSHCRDHIRVVGCEACGTEGRVLVGDVFWDRAIGGFVPGERDEGPCPYCEGTGGEIIETQPIEMEDLEHV